MLVLPRITAPASRSRSVMWASNGATVALEDPRAGGALAARDRDEVLERDRDAQQRVEGRDGVGALGARRGEPRVGRVGLGERAVVDRSSARR